jgi:hypothetical protein
MVLDALDAEECHERVEAWRRADSYTYMPEREGQAEPAVAERKVPPARELKTVGRR